MDLAVPGGKISVLSNGDKPAGVAPDAQIRVHATCFYQFTQNRQVLKPMLLVPRRVPIIVLNPPPADSDSLPIRLVGSLLAFSPASAWGHRVRVRGVVTRQDPGTFVFMRDSSGALRIQTKQTERLEPGDEIDVLGFPKYGSFIPALEDATFQKRSSGTPPAPIDLPTLEAAFEHQADLVAVVATLTDVQRLPDGWIFKLQKDGTPFNAAARFGDVGSSNWRPGSVVRASGICSVLGDDTELVLSGIWHPQTFELLLRSPADLQILQAPPWWTPRHIILALLAATGASVLVTGTVMLLARRRLREQANRRAMAEAEFAAILSERNRVAREIHDTLAQGLVATSVHLRLAKKSINGSSEPLTHHLDAAQDLVRDSLEEARNSIWNMRSQILETSDLAGALGGILRQMADGSELKTGLEVRGRPRRLSPVFENNILRVGQEAISNAVRHAAARSVSVTLTFGEKDFELSVEDDGRGFGPDKAPPGKGGFGLVGMRERADHIKGDLQIHSAPDRGTRITLRLPLASE
jgi:signal transduction histidine kinase